MAKKAKKPAAKKVAAKKPLKLVKPGSKKVAKSAAAKKPKVADKGKAKAVAKSARSQPLPGMEQVRNTILDKCAESIADCRATMNEARQEEAGYIQTALREMQKEALKLGQTSYAYKHNGVELLLVPGDAKLRVRALKDGGEDSMDVDEPLRPVPGADDPIVGDVLTEAFDQDAADEDAADDAGDVDDFDGDGDEPGDDE